PILERTKRGAGAGNCNGGRKTYKTFCYGHRNGDRGREADVQKCFDRLYARKVQPWGCQTLTEGRCRCTVDSSYIFGANGRWSQTFREAREKLYQGCGGFTNNIMERYEGTLYLTATC
ncbi:unnamed protein product, partial [Didymodactylos carnosus]